MHSISSTQTSATLTPISSLPECVSPIVSVTLSEEMPETMQLDQHDLLLNFDSMQLESIDLPSESNNALLHSNNPMLSSTARVGFALADECLVAPVFNQFGQILPQTLDSDVLLTLESNCKLDKMDFTSLIDDDRNSLSFIPSSPVAHSVATSCTLSTLPEKRLVPASAAQPSSSSSDRDSFSVNFQPTISKRSEQQTQQAAPTLAKKIKFDAPLVTRQSSRGSLKAKSKASDVEQVIYEPPTTPHKANESCSASCAQATQEQLKILQDQLAILEGTTAKKYYKLKLKVLSRYYSEKIHEKSTEEKVLFCNSFFNKFIDIGVVEYWAFAYIHGGLPLLKGCKHKWVLEADSPLAYDKTAMLELYTTLIEGTYVSLNCLAKKYKIALTTLKDMIYRMGLVSCSAQRGLVLKNEPTFLSEYALLRKKRVLLEGVDPSSYTIPVILHKAEQECGANCTQVTADQIRTLEDKLARCNSDPCFSLAFFKQKLRVLVKYYKENFHQRSENITVIRDPDNGQEFDISVVDYWSFAYLHGGLPLLRGSCNNASVKNFSPTLHDGKKLLDLYNTMIEGSYVTFSDLANKYKIAQSTLREQVQRMGLFISPMQKGLLLRNDNDIPCQPKAKRRK